MVIFKSKPIKHSSYCLEVEKYLSQVQLDFSKYPELLKHVQLIKLNKEDLAVLRQLKPLSVDFIPNMVDQFYDAVSLSGHLMDIINKNSRIEKLKITLTKHLTEIFEGRINNDSNPIRTCADAMVLRCSI